MTKKKSSGGSDDRTTSRGTVKGHHPDPDDAVPEGGKAASPTEGKGAIAGDDTSNATVGKREKEQAEAANAGKPQSGHHGGG